jgi:23S rRNA pseudouridine2605 synthase
MREGKNREVKNVLGHLGLAVNRLIRVSFGPFQLGDLLEGAVEEVRTRHLREQLGERITALAGADFAAPVIAHAPPQEQVRRPEARAKRASKGDGPGRSSFEGRQRRPPQDDGERSRKKNQWPKRRAFDAERLGEPELARREKRRRFRKRR